MVTASSVAVVVVVIAAVVAFVVVVCFGQRPDVQVSQSVSRTQSSNSLQL